MRQSTVDADRTLDIAIYGPATRLLNECFDMGQYLLPRAWYVYGALYERKADNYVYVVTREESVC